mgnify:CR=1 FL=1
MHFDLLKALRYIERVKTKKKKTYFTTYMRNMFWATILYKYHDDDNDGKVKEGVWKVYCRVWVWQQH